ncbi:methyl-accepting chemotaxis protein [Halobacillus faecis]|uniref:Methyl-accepting chemotaxis protein n=1 Tax=Halobacillus faecis TaxID=360184 RepID=A0A511WZ58_9BACI|nr:methyl-accepting chemotaxis protein [Halobacillus faecis]GEN55512.1 methyl-accepting chemotaxis protein [Halobacillus faecis]
MDESTKMLNLRNQLMFKIMAFVLIADIVLLVIRSSFATLGIVFSAGLVLMSGCYFLIYKTEKVRLTMYLMTSSMFALVAALNVFQSNVVNYNTIFFVLVLISLYQNSKLMMAGGSVAATFAGLFYIWDPADVFVNAPTKYVFYIVLLVILITTILTTVSRLNESIMRDFKAKKDEANELTEQSQRSLEKMKEAAGLIDEFSSSLNARIQQTNEIMINFSSSFQEMETSLEDQSQSTVDINSSVEQSDQSIQTITDESEEMLMIATETQNASQTGNSEVLKLNDEIEKVSDIISKSSKTIEELNTSSTDILSFLDVIKDISEQTNLLALNASIEAARAGEEGKGFSVVAEEIKKLASRSQQMTENITEIVSNLQIESQRASQNAQQGQDVVKVSENAAGRVSEEFKNISAYIERFNLKSENITTLVNDLKSASSEIVSQINNVSSITEENTSAVKDLSGSIETQSDQLNQIVEDFQELENQTKNLK